MIRELESTGAGVTFMRSPRNLRSVFLSICSVRALLLHERVVVPLECCNAPVPLAFPGVHRVLTVPSPEEGAVLLGDDASAGVDAIQIE